MTEFLLCCCYLVVLLGYELLLPLMPAGIVIGLVWIRKRLREESTTSGYDNLWLASHKSGSFSTPGLSQARHNVESQRRFTECRQNRNSSVT